MTNIDVANMTENEFLAYYDELTSKILLTGVHMVNICRPHAKYARIRATDKDGKKYYYDVEIDPGTVNDPIPGTKFWNACQDGFYEASGYQGKWLTHVHIREIGYEIPKRGSTNVSNMAIIAVNFNRLAFSIGGAITDKNGRNNPCSIIQNAVQDSRRIKR